MANKTIGGISSEQLRQFIERIESLEEERIELMGTMRDTYLEAKVNGYDPKILRQVIRLRKMDKQEAEEQEAILSVYMQALGMIPSQNALEDA